jgi:serine protease Do
MSLFQRIRHQKFLSFTLVLFTLSIGVLIGTLVSTGVKAAKDQVAAPGATPLSIPNPVQLSNSFSTLAKQLEPSVVNISSTYVQKAPVQAKNRRRPAPDQDGEEEPGMQDFFERFFGNPFGGEQTPQGPRRGYSMGSGVVVDKAGYILTNNHVVDKASKVQVKFNGDPTEYEAKIIGTDSATDIAVIKVEKKSVVPAKIGNSDGVQVGDWAVAIGSPFGFQATVTAGIISAKSREVPGSQDPNNQGFQHFIQTDAAINPGNSGGPLLNIAGEVIGINTMIASRSGGYQGIGFALPVNTAVKVYNQIIKTGKVTRGSIGITFNADDDRNRQLVQSFGASSGIFVQNVEAGGPADKAGIKQEDIITHLNGKPVARGVELMETVADTPIGEKMAVTALRNGKKEDFTIVIGDRSKVFASRFGSRPSTEPEPGEATQAKFGIYIQNLSDSARENLGFKDKGGVLVTQVESGSFAEDVGIVANDIITAINRLPVNNADDLKRIQNTLKPGESVSFRVKRAAGKGQDWTTLYLPGTLPSN